MRVRKPTLTRKGIATLRRNTHRVEISKPEISTGHQTQVKVLTTEPGVTAPVPNSDCGRHWRPQQTVNLWAFGPTGFNSLTIHQSRDNRRTMSSAQSEMLGPEFVTGDS